MEKLFEKTHLVFENSTILIVDDNSKNLQVLGQIIKELGCKTAFASSGKKALKFLENKQADLILLDIMMPEMDGYEVCRLLKSDSAFMDIPVIFVTAMDDTENEKKGFDTGAVDYIRKPFNPDIVRARILTHLRLKIKTNMLENLAGIDGLTDIPNRRKLDERLLAESLRALRKKSSISFIMIDIDNFKNYNDNYGHSQGDICLRMVAKEIKSSVKRSSDFAARFGGEEFAVILPDIDAFGAVAVAEKIRKNIERLGLKHEYSDVSDHVTISVGVGTIEKVNQNEPQKIVDIADKALYESKKKGKNMVTNQVLPSF